MNDAPLFFKLLGLVEEADLSMPPAFVGAQAGDIEIGVLPDLLQRLCLAVLMLDQEVHAVEKQTEAGCEAAEQSHEEMRASAQAELGFLRRQLHAAEQMFWASVEGCFRREILASEATGSLTVRESWTVCLLRGGRRNRVSMVT